MSYAEEVNSGFDVYRTTRRFGETYLGLTLRSTPDWVNQTNQVIDFRDWAPLSPEDSSWGCMATDKGGLYRDLPCSDPARAVSCMSKLSTPQWRFSNGSSYMVTFPPRPFTNKTRTIAYDGSDSFQVLTAADDLVALVDTSIIYGLTVQLAIQHCLIGDNLTVPNFAALYPTLSLVYYPTICALMVTGEEYVSTYKVIADLIRFQTPATGANGTNAHYRTRMQLSFGWVAWPSITDANLTIDVETKSIYSFRLVNGTGSAHWVRTQEYCREQGPFWTGATMTTVHQREFIWRLPLPPTEPIPIGLRYTDTVGFNWHSQEPVTLLDWHSTMPITPYMTYRCVHLYQNQKWNNTDCYTKRYPYAVCKTRNWNLQGTVAWVSPFSIYNTSKKFIFRGALAKRIAADSSTIVYGATLNTRARFCHPDDSWGMERGEDRILMTYNNSCFIFFGGTAEVTEYNNVIRSVAWFGDDNNTRSTVTIAYTLWTDPIIKDIIIDMDSALTSKPGGTTLKQYSTVPAAASWTAPAGIVNYAQQYCYTAQSGFYVAEINTEWESRQQHLTTRWGEAVLGGRRTGASGWVWMTTTPTVSLDNFTEWVGGVAPPIATYCTFRTTLGRTRHGLCTDRAPSVACEKDLSVHFGQASFTLKTRFIDWAPDQSFPAYDMNVTNWLDTARPAYGLTLQLHVEQCDPTTDGFTFSPALPGWTSLAYLPKCITFIKSIAGTKTVLEYKNIMASARFITTTAELLTRTQFSLAWVIWTDPGIKNMMMERNHRRSIAYFDMGGSQNHDDALLQCNNFNLELPVITSVPERTLFAQLLTGTALHLHLWAFRNTSGTFLWKNNEPMALIDWDEGSPATPLSTTPGCMAMKQILDGRWVDVDCVTDTNTNRVACETTKWDYSDIYSWITRPGGEENMVVDNVFKPENFANIFVPVMYGATVQTSMKDCRYLDTYMFYSSSDNIHAILIKECVLYLSGYATMEEYNMVLQGVQWRAQYPYGDVDGQPRTAMTINFIYWTNKYASRMGLDPQSGHAYSSFLAHTYFDKTIGPINGKWFCQQFNMYPKEIFTANQYLEQLRTQQYGNEWIGGRRDPATNDFNWTMSKVPITYNGWALLQPNSTLLRCLMQDGVGFKWSNMDCALHFLPAIGCMANQWPNAWNQTTNNISGLLNGTIPLVNQTMQRFIKWDSYNGYIYDGQEHINIDWFPKVAPCYGFTIQMAPQHCMPGDLIWLPVKPPAQVKQYYNAPACALYLDGPAQRTVYSGFIRQFQFNSSHFNKLRTQIAFSWLLWINPAIKNMSLNHENFHAYTWIKKSFTFTYIESSALCSSLGVGWDIASPRTPQQVKTVMSVYQYPGTPIRALKSVTSGERYVWQDGSRFQYFNWASGFPSGIPNENCTWVDSATMQWVNGECFSPIFTMTACENTKWIVSGVVSFQLDLSAIEYNVKSDTIFAGTLSDAVNAIPMIYGMTVQTPATSCRVGDRFMLTLNNALITVLDTKNCVAYMYGEASGAEYNAVLNGMMWIAQYPFRMEQSFSWIAWTDRDLRELIVDVTSAKTFVSYDSPTYADPVVEDPYRFAFSLCWNMGLEVAEPSTRSQVLEQQRTSQAASQWLGWRRDVANDYRSLRDVSLIPTFSNWAPMQPNKTSNQCIRKGAGGKWRDADCIKRMMSVGCESLNYTYWNWTTRSITYQVSPDDTFNMRYLIWDPTSYNGIYPVNISDGAFGWILNGTTVYGATVQVTAAHCSPGDLLSVPGNNPAVTLITTEYYTRSCSLYLRGQSFVSNYRQLMAGVVFNTTTFHRSTVTFNWVLWPTNEMTELGYDPETKHVYGIDKPGWGMHWEDVYDRCVGRFPVGDWHPVVISHLEEERIILTQYSNNYTRNVPLNFAQASGTLKNYVWSPSLIPEPSYVEMWAVAEPRGNTWPPATTSEQRCVEYQTGIGASNGGQFNNGDRNWVQINCFTPRYLFATCEIDTFDYAAQITYVARGDDLVPNPFLVTCFALGALPSASATIIYGATIQLPLSQTRPSDRFMPSILSTAVYSVFDREGTGKLELAGVTSVSNYNVLLAGLQLIGYRGNRDVFTFGYVYWAARNVRRMFMDFNTMHTYAPLPMTSRMGMNDTFGYKYFPMPRQTCQSLGMYPVEINSAVEQREVLRGAVFGQAWLGAWRKTALQRPFLWMQQNDTIGTANIYDNWHPYEPWVNTSLGQTWQKLKMCAKMDRTTGLWFAEVCFNLLPSIVCEASVGNYTGKYTPYVTPINRPTIRRAASWPNLASAVQRVTLSILDGAETLSTSWHGKAFFGITWQMHPGHCNPLDVVQWIGGVQPAIVSTFTYESPSCIAYAFTVNSTIDQMKVVAESVELVAGEYRRIQIVFSLLFWDQPYRSPLLMSFETKHVYLLLKSTTGNLNWYTAYEQCKQVGPDWTIPAVMDVYEHNLLMYNVTTYLRAPIALHADINGTFEWATKEPLDWLNWNYTGPLNVNVNWTQQVFGQCTEMNYYWGGKWVPVACNSSVFTHYWCERNFTDYFYQVAYVGDLVNFGSTLQAPIFAQGDFPITSNEVVYGATVQLRRETCLPTDQIVLLASNDLIALRGYQDCIAWFQGPTYLADYVNMLSGLAYSGHDMGRSYFEYQYTIWTAPLIADLLVNRLNLETFAVVPMNWFPVAPPWYDFNPLFKICRNHNMKPFEITSNEQILSVRRVIPTTQALNLIGAYRDVAGVDRMNELSVRFRWNTSNADIWQSS